MTRRVVVLGASGFIGQNIIAALMRAPSADGVHAVAGLRHPKAWAASGMDAAVELVKCEATKLISLRDCLRGADHVINCVGGPPPLMTEGFRLLCEAARLEAVTSIVHLSSMAVYGGREGLVDETMPFDASPGAYAEAKIACEIEAERAARQGGPAFVILRPGCVFGPGSPQWTTRIGDLLRAGRIGDLGANGDGACNLSFVDDLAAAALAALGIAGGLHVFNVAAPEIPTWNEFLIQFGCAIGAVPLERVSQRWLTLETKVIAPGLRLADRAADALHINRRAIPPAIPPSLAALWRQDIRLDHKAADARLGFARTPFDAGVAAAAQWYVAMRKSQTGPGGFLTPGSPELTASGH